MAFTLFTFVPITNAFLVLFQAKESSKCQTNQGTIASGSESHFDEYKNAPRQFIVQVVNPYFITIFQYTCTSQTSTCTRKERIYFWRCETSDTILLFQPDIFS